MSDILGRAEDLAERYNSSGFIHKEATLLLPDLIAEIKRLEDALVEERLSRNSKNRACLDGYGPEYDTEEFAREQLRAEGVIR